MAKRQFAIFFLDTNKAYFFGSNIEQALQMEIPADVMAYWDIVSRDKLYQIIQTLVSGNKIEPVPLLILLAPSASYEMDAPPNKPSEESNGDIEKFLDSIPFDKVMSRSYKLQSQTKIVGANRDIYEAIKHGFERFHFTTVGVVPLGFLQKVMPEIGTTLNFETLAGKFEAMKQYSLITSEELSSIGKSTIVQQDAEKPNPARLYGLIGVFGVLLLVLGIMVYFSLQPSPKPTTNLPVQGVTPLPTTIPTITPAVKVGSPSGQSLSPTIHLSPTATVVR